MDGLAARDRAWVALVVGALAVLGGFQPLQRERSLLAVALGGCQLFLEVLDRGEEIGAPLGRCLREGGIGEMRLVPDAGAVLLVGDLAGQLGREVLEVADRPFERGDLAGLLGDLEPLRPHRGITWLHRVPQHPNLFDRLPLRTSALLLRAEPATGPRRPIAPTGLGAAFVRPGVRPGVRLDVQPALALDAPRRKLRGSV